MREKVLVNKAECAICHDVIESKHVHDFRSCGCGEISVDGGREYIRRAAKHLSNIIERSEIIEQPVSEWLADDVRKSKDVGYTIKQGLRWGAVLGIELAIRNELSDLTVGQCDKIGKILLRELVGEK
jgi:hypothetical protein